MISYLLFHAEQLTPILQTWFYVLTEKSFTPINFLM